MIQLRLAALLLAGLSGVSVAQEPGQKEPGGLPKHRRGPPESLVKLPEDYVQYARVPDGGLRPRLGTGKTGLALIYSKGGGAGDLYLTQSKDEAKSFSPAIRLNPTPGTVLSWNGTQSGSIDVGPDGRVHVVWVTAGEKPSLQYVRTTEAGAPEDVLDLGSPAGLGTTTAVTVDDGGQVYVVYSAEGVELDMDGTPKARIWLRRSADGTSFTEPVAIDQGKDVSVHSDIAAHVDEIMGTVFVLFRASFQPNAGSAVISRGMRLLSSKDRGETFSFAAVDNLKHMRDPLSSGQLSQEANSTLAAWDGDGRVCWSIIRRQLQQPQLPVEPDRLGPDLDCTHAAAASGGNEVILSWLERPAKDRAAPARLGWQVWLREGRLSQGEGHAPEPALADGQVVFPRRTGGFTILY